MRRCTLYRHGRLSYPVGTSRIAVGHQLLPLFPSNDIFYDAPKLRMRLDTDGYLYFKNIIPREVVHSALNDLANQMCHCGWTLEDDRQKQAARDGFALGVPFPSTGGELPSPRIEFTETIRSAVSGSSMMAVVRQVFGGAVQASTLQSLHLGMPQESFGFRMPSVYMNQGTKLSLVALVPLHDIPMHMGTPVIIQGSNTTDSYAPIRQTYGQLDVEKGDIRGDGCFTAQPEELLPIGKQPGRDSVTGAPIIVDVNPFVSCALEAGDVLLITVYTMYAILTNTSNCWRIMAEAVWTMEGDDIGPDPRYMGDLAPGLGNWFAERDNPEKYPRTMNEAKKDWGLLPKVHTE